MAIVSVLATGGLLGGILGLGNVAGASPRAITGATFEWSVSEEANTGAYNGQCNFMSAGASDGYAPTYKASDGNATVVKLTAGGTDAPVSDYATRCKDKDGVNVTAAGTRRLGQKVVYTGGTGTADAQTGEISIQWAGTFSVNYYGTLTPFWFSDPKLTVDGSGHGQVTATMAGYSSSVDNPDVRVLLPAVPDVVIATMTVNTRNTQGFSVTPDFAGVTYDSNDTPQSRFYAGWGSWPTSMVDVMNQLGLGAYWYSTGGAADVRKPAAPITVGFGPDTAPATTTTTSTTSAPGSTTTTAPGTSTTTTAPATATTTASSTTTTTTVAGSQHGIGVTVDLPQVEGESDENPGTGDPGAGGGGVLPDNEFSWTIDASQSGITLAPVAGGSGQLRFSGTLSGVTVIDTRNGSPAWSLSGQVGNFSGGLSGKYLGWTPKIVTAGAGAIPGGSVVSGIVAGNGLRDAAPLASAAAGHPKGSATVGADLELVVPAGTASGRQTATLTLTALG